MTDAVAAARLWEPGPAVIPFIKGRVALYAILRAAGIGPGDEVLIPGFTCVVVAGAVGYTGARPVFYDIVPETYNGDPEQAVAMITERTRAVLVQHTFGMPADLGRLPTLCRERDILLVEDCAHATGALTPAGPAGSLGDAAFTSFQWSKPVTTGLGGAARINRPDLAEKLRRIADEEFDEPSLLKSLTLLTVSSAFEHLFRPAVFWTVRDAYRWLGKRGLVAGSSSAAELVDPAIPAAYAETFGRPRHGQIARVLRRLPATIAHRTAIARRYAEWCDGHGFARQHETVGSASAHLRFPLLVNDRPRLLADARANRIEIGDWFNAPLHPAEAAGEAFGYTPGTCPVGDRLAQCVINLPTHRRVSGHEAERVLSFMDRHLPLVVRDPHRELGLDNARGKRA